MNNKWYHAKVPPKRFHFDGHILSTDSKVRTTLHVFITDCWHGSVIKININNVLAYRLAQDILWICF